MNGCVGREVLIRKFHIKLKVDNEYLNFNLHFQLKIWFFLFLLNHGFQHILSTKNKTKNKHTGHGSIPTLSAASEKLDILKISNYKILNLSSEFLFLN